MIAGSPTKLPGGLFTYSGMFSEEKTKACFFFLLIAEEALPQGFLYLSNKANGLFLIFIL